MPVHRITEGVVTKCLAIPLCSGLQIHHGVVIRPGTKRRHEVIEDTIFPDRRDVVRHLADTYSFHVANALDARVIPVDIHIVDVFTPIVPIHFTGNGKQARTAGQYLLIIQQALFNSSSQL